MIFNKIQSYSSQITPIIIKLLFNLLRLNYFQFLCLIHMSQVKIIVGRPFRHINKKVFCSATEYLLALPIQTFTYVQIIQQLTFPTQYNLLISILAQKKDSLSSFRQFYEVRQQALRIFNRKIEIDYHYLCTQLLGDNDGLLKSLDQCKFIDLQTIIHKAYDKISEKFHSKFNRRIKKYLSQSVRSENEKNQIIKIIDLIKSEQTDEEQEIVKKPSIKQAKPVKPQTSKRQKIQKRQQPSDKQQSQQSYQANDDEQEPKKKVEPSKKSKLHVKKDNHHHHKKEQQQDENDWQDVKTQKFNKRKEKNNKKMHEKYDLKDAHDHDNTVSDEDEEPVKIPVPVKKSQKKYKENRGSNEGVKKLFEKSKEKPKKDLRILLGLNGDTYDGWRQRMRSERFPSTSAYVKQQKKEEKKEQKKQKWGAKKEVSQPKTEQKSEPIAKIQSQTPTPNQVPQQPQVVKLEPSSSSLQKIFSYPTDGSKFKLNPSKQYRLKVNNNFWVILQKNKLTIQKDKSGFIRDGKFQSNDDYILQAHDLTITFDGLSNLQDGGQRFGNPNIQDFTEGSSQWFTVKQLEIYGYGS